MPGWGGGWGGLGGRQVPARGCCKNAPCRAWLCARVAERGVEVVLDGLPAQPGPWHAASAIDLLCSVVTAATCPCPAAAATRAPAAHLPVLHGCAGVEDLGSGHALQPADGPPLGVRPRVALGRQHHCQAGVGAPLQLDLAQEGQRGQSLCAPRLPLLSPCLAARPSQTCHGAVPACPPAALAALCPLTSSPRHCACRLSSRSLCSRTMSDWHSGSPNRTLCSSSLAWRAGVGVVVDL